MKETDLASGTWLYEEEEEEKEDEEGGGRIDLTHSGKLCPSD